MATRPVHFFRCTCLAICYLLHPANIAEMRWNHQSAVTWWLDYEFRPVMATKCFRHIYRQITPAKKNGPTITDCSSKCTIKNVFKDTTWWKRYHNSLLNIISLRFMLKLCFPVFFGIWSMTSHSVTYRNINSSCVDENSHLISGRPKM